VRRRRKHLRMGEKSGDSTGGGVGPGLLLLLFQARQEVQALWRREMSFRDDPRGARKD